MLMGNIPGLLVLPVILHLDMSYLSNQLLKKRVGRCIPNLEGRVGDGLKIFFAKLQLESSLS